MLRTGGELCINGGWSFVFWSILFARCFSTPVKMRSGYHPGPYHYTDLISLLNRQCGNSNYVNVILHSNISIRDLGKRKCSTVVLSLDSAVTDGFLFDNRTSFDAETSFNELYNLVAYNVPADLALRTLNEYSFLQRHVDLACFIFVNRSGSANETLTTSIDVICCQAIFVYDMLPFNSETIKDLTIESLNLKYLGAEFGVFVLSRTLKSVCSDCGVARPIANGFDFSFTAPNRLEVSFVNCTPHFIVGSNNSTEQTEIYPLHGTETWLLNDSAAHFNFSYKLTENLNKSWGSLLGEGRNRFWVGMVADVFNRAADLALTEISNVYVRNQAIQYTKMFVMEKSLFVSKRGVQVPSASALWWPLDNISWSLTAASLLVYSFTIMAFVRFYDTTSIFQLSRVNIVARRSRDLPPADFIMLVSTLAKQSIDGYREYRTLSYKILIMWWWIFAVIITHVYSSLILSFMSVPVFLPGVDTFDRLLEEMKAGRMTAGAQMTGFGSGILQSYDHPVAKYIMSNFFNSEYFPKERGSGMFLAADDRLNYAFIDMRNFILAMMRTNNWDEKLQLSRNYFSVTGSSWILQKRCFMLHYFNGFIRKEMEGGFIAFYLRKALTVRKVDRSVEGRAESIDTGDIFGHLCLYGFGISLAVVYLIFEIVLRKRKKRSSRKFGNRTILNDSRVSARKHLDALLERRMVIKGNADRLTGRPESAEEISPFLARLLGVLSPELSRRVDNRFEKDEKSE